jgi:O-antigen/teichoic acid export membrane protein
MRNLINPISKISGAVVLIFLGAGVSGLIGGYLFGITVAIICGTVFLFWEADWIRSTAIQSVSNRSLVSYALPLAMAGVVYTIIGQIDTFLIGFFRTSSEVGYYDVAYLLAANLLIALNAITPVFKPMIAEVQSDTQSVRERYKLATRWVTMLTIPPAITLLLAPDVYLGVLFTQEYIVASGATFVLAIGYLLNAASGPEGMVLEGLGYTKVTFLNSVILLGINSVLGVIFIPRLGIVGAGIATAAALGGVGLLGVAELYFLKGFHPFTVKLLRVYAAAIVPVTSGWIFTSVLTDQKLIALSLPILIMICYVIGLRAAGGFTNKDIKVAEKFDNRVGYNIVGWIIS